MDTENDHYRALLLNSGDLEAKIGLAVKNRRIYEM